MKTVSVRQIQHSLGRWLWLPVLLLALSSGAAEETDASSPESVIRQFYQWYVPVLVSQRDPFEKDRAQLKRFVTERLLRQIDHARKGPDGLDGDYFVDAQDFDQEWARNITVSTPIIQNKHAAVEVELKSSELGPRNLLVDLVWDHGTWKFDKVESHQ
jgi:hypothetical protein